MATKSCWRPTTARPAGLSRTSRISSNCKLRSQRRQLLSVKPKIAARNKLKPADREKFGQAERFSAAPKSKRGGFAEACDLPTTGLDSLAIALIQFFHWDT